jgi:opacity protein-like surface antigen
VAGGGLEVNVGEIFGIGTSVFAEYLRAEFDSFKNAPGLGVDIDAEVQTFRVGVKLKLGHDYHEERRRYEPLK